MAFGVLLTAGASAVPLLDRVASRSALPHTADTYYQRGLALTAKPAQAIGQFSRCLRVDRAHCACHRELGSARERAGDRDGATRQWMRYLDTCPEEPDAEGVLRRLGELPPRAPKEVTRCSIPLIPTEPVVTPVGETVRYHVDVNGISVGQLDFKVERTGTLGGKDVTEYRSVFALDALASTFVPMKGRAASVVPAASVFPTQAMMRFSVRDKQVAEDLRFSGAGREVRSDRSIGDRRRVRRRRYAPELLDFVAGFYAARRLPPDADGCAVLFGNGRAYTFWVRGMGPERISTPTGPKVADRFVIRYGHETSRDVVEGEVWIGQDAHRLPYRAEARGKYHLVARVHLFDKGAPSPEL